jgi:hypothetical protein
MSAAHTVGEAPVGGACDDIDTAHLERDLGAAGVLDRDDGRQLVQVCVGDLRVLVVDLVELLDGPGQTGVGAVARLRQAADRSVRSAGLRLDAVSAGVVPAEADHDRMTRCCESRTRKEVTRETGQQPGRGEGRGGMRKRS